MSRQCFGRIIVAIEKMASKVKARVTNEAIINPLFNSSSLPPMLNIKLRHTHPKSWISWNAMAHETKTMLVGFFARVDVVPIRGT